MNQISIPKSDPRLEALATQLQPHLETIRGTIDTLGIFTEIDQAIHTAMGPTTYVSHGCWKRIRGSFRATYFIRGAHLVVAFDPAGHLSFTLTLSGKRI